MRSHWLRLLAALLAFTLIAAACGGDDDDDGAVATDGAAEDDGGEEPAPEPEDDGGAGDDDGEEPAGDDDGDAPAPSGGGELVLAVEQWPECLNPVTSWANSSWLSWSVHVHVLPRLMELDVNNAFQASPVLTEAPSVENGGIVTNDDGTFTLTFNINPDAVWSDGTPITSADVEFTWRAKIDTEGTLNTNGYDLITGIDASDPQVAVITFSENYAPWPDMFGGTTEYLLPAHAFASTDVSGDWNDAITLSGGPWISESWSADQHILVPNPMYWDASRAPQVDRVVMVPREDTDSEVVALQTGEAMAAFPQPFPGAKDRLVGDLTFIGGGGTFMEGLWINQLAPDRNFDMTKNVRQAVAYSIDREQVADVALGSIIDDPAVLQCAGWNPTFGDWCQDSDFAKYVQDADMVASLLEAEGWTRPDPDGLWVNADGQELVIQWNTVAGNKRREDVQALVTEMTKPFGIGWEIINYDAGELFQNRLPVLNFGPVALFANSTSPDPSVTSLYDINGIPTEENGFSGQNFTAYENQEASDLAFAIDAAVDPVERLALVTELGVILGEDVPWLPLYLLPNLLTWNTTLVEGPGDWAFSAYSGFANMYEWTVIG